MSTLTSILVATDFSRNAQLAVARAARIAVHAGGRLDIVHVARPISRSLMAWLRSEPVAAAALDTTQRKLDAAVAHAIELGADARGHLVSGEAIASLEATSRRLKSGLVVLGAHGAHAIRDRLLGTTAERLIERLPCDALVVRRRERAAYRRLLVCVDTSPAASRALGRALELGPGATVHVLHAFEPPLDGILRGSNLRRLAEDHSRNERLRVRKDLMAFLGDAGFDVDALRIDLKKGYAPRVIERAAKHLAPDLIAIGHHSSALAQVFLGSVAKHVLRSSACDVLITHQ